MHLGVSLMALALGYFAFVYASKESKGTHKTIGRALGVYVMTLSFLSTVLWLVQYANYTGMMLSSGNCPFLSKLCHR